MEIKNHHFNPALEAWLDFPENSEEGKNLFRDFETRAYIAGFNLAGIHTSKAVMGDSHGDLTYIIFDRHSRLVGDLQAFINARESLLTELNNNYYEISLFDQVYLTDHVLMVLEES